MISARIRPRNFSGCRPGREVRLKYAYYITCTDVIKDPNTGEITELHCTYDPDTKGGWSKDGRKVKGTSHWISAAHACPGGVPAVRSPVHQTESGRTAKDFCPI